MQISYEILAFIAILTIIVIILFLKFYTKNNIKQSRYKAESGDIVRSRAELIIANWLFYRGINFIYEKKVLPNENIKCDFYLSDFDIFIEFWGLETKEYLRRKNEKIKLYKKHKIRLISMDENSLRDLNQFFNSEFKRLGVKYINALK